MQRRDLLLAGAAVPAGALAQNGARTARKVLRVSIPTPEGALDPVQTNSDLRTNEILGHIFESPLAYDYLARPARLQPLTALALPEVSRDSKVFTLRIRPGIRFADDPAFGG
jgi:ABC-type transport system substrate-binding protein